MILSTGWRTDIPAFYSDWIVNRINEGFVCYRNPANPKQFFKLNINHKTTDIITFCSKDYSKLLPKLDPIDSKYRCFYYYTITPYDTDVEPNVPSVDESIATFKALSDKVGKRKVVWRYDPILFTSKYTMTYHIRMFKYIATQLKGYTDTCIFSFVHMYMKTRMNMPEIIDITEPQKQTLCRTIDNICQECGMTTQTCGMGNKYAIGNIKISSCSNPELFGNAFNVKFKDTAMPGLREGCGCMPQKTIGEFETCLHGCKYCYAVKSYKQALQNNAYHNKFSSMFIGELPDDAEIIEVNEKLLINDIIYPELNLF